MKTNNTPNFNEALKAYEYTLTQTRDEFESTDFYEATITQLSHLLVCEGQIRYYGNKVAIRWTIDIDGQPNQFTIRVDVYEFARECDAVIDGGVNHYGDTFGLVRQYNPQFNGFASEEEYERNLEYAKKCFPKEYGESDTFAVYAKGDKMEIVWSCSAELMKA